MQINKDDSIKCQWCTSLATVQEWNDESFKECKSREMRRAFKDVTNVKVWGMDSNHFYKCPNCGTWSRGNQLILVKEDGNIVKGLGGKPILVVSKKDN